jgi:hypothetical protein
MSTNITAFEVVVACPFCHKESELTVTTTGAADNYSFRCPYPDCNEHFMRELPGEIIDGSHLN